MTAFLEVLVQGLSESAIPFTEEQISKCQDYYDLLMDWNKKINLTSIEDDQEVAIKHFMDSILCTKYLTIKDSDSLIDVGTGAGFPGLPIKIFFPKLKLVLLDSLAKRCNFLSEVVGSLGLENVMIVHGRAEDIGRDPAFREQFTLATARAVTSLPVLAEYCLPFLKIDGCFFALKGPDITEEMAKGENAIKIMGGFLKDQKYYHLPISGDARSLVLIEKIRPTHHKYPRKAGIPAKQPII